MTEPSIDEPFIESTRSSILEGRMLVFRFNYEGEDVPGYANFIYPASGLSFSADPSDKDFASTARNFIESAGVAPEPNDHLYFDFVAPDGFKPSSYRPKSTS